MRVIPVIDLLNGVVVRGVAGRRETYQPMTSAIAADCHPATVARAFSGEFGFDTVYVADLDAIQRGKFNTTAWRQIASAGVSLWLDAGIGRAIAARNIIGLTEELAIEARLVLGLESLHAESELDAIRDVSLSQRPIFSLDLNSGRPLTRIPAWQSLTPLEIAKVVLEAGYRDLIILDLADVGTNGGTRTLNLCREVRDLAVPGVNIVGGGGVRSLADLTQLGSAGCNAALVASALHDNRLTPDDIREFTN